MSFNFMAAVAICSDFGAPQNSLSLFPLFLHLFAMMLKKLKLNSSVKTYKTF